MFTFGPSSRGGDSDPLYASVVALLNLQGADGAASFVDQSSYARAYSAVNSPLLSTSTAPTGFASAADFEATNKGIITTAAQAELNLGGGDFCVEGFFRLSSLPGGSYNHVLGVLGSGLQLQMSLLWKGDSTRFAAFFNGSYITQSHFLPTINTWFHYAVTYQHVGTTCRFYANGVEVGSTAQAYSAGFSSKLMLGRDANFGTGNSVRIAGVRVTRGSRRYTGAFTPPAAPHPAG